MAPFVSLLTVKLVMTGVVDRLRKSQALPSTTIVKIFNTIGEPLHSIFHNGLQKSKSVR